LGFNHFTRPNKFHHEFQVLEAETHEPLSDKLALHFYELKKLPPLNDTDSLRSFFHNWVKINKGILQT